MNDIEFLVPEFEYYPKGWKWNISLALIAISVGALGWFTKNYTLIGLIAISWLALVIRQFNKPDLVQAVITQNGISIGNKDIDYKNLKNFSISEIEGKLNLILNPETRFGMVIKLPISDPDKITKKLNNYLPRVEYEESFMDSLIRLLRI